MDAQNISLLYRRCKSEVSILSTETKRQVGAEHDRGLEQSEDTDAGVEGRLDHCFSK